LELIDISLHPTDPNDSETRKSSERDGRKLPEFEGDPA
jgi:hypothetical protein